MNEATTAVEDVKTFRGSTLEALLPQIRDELGPEAVIVRQREGLVGGVGGFFQKKCVEVEAKPGGPRIDVFDEDAWDEADDPRVLSPAPPARESDLADAPPVRNDTATREGLATPAVKELVAQAQPFAEMLAELEPAAEIEGPPKARALVEGMVKAGLGEDISREVVEAVLASSMPFTTPGRLRTVVRNELALRIPVAPAAAPGPRTIAFAGPAGAGKSAALEAIRAAHEAAGTAEELTLIEARDPGDAPRGAEVHLVLRAGTAGPAAAEAIEQASVPPTRLLLSGAGESSHLGGVADAAIRFGIPLGYVAAGPAEIAPADPRELAGRIVR
jgi:flagellar biosynthesis GTPase FlhF